MGGSGVSEEYVPPKLARLFHSVPHMNITVHRVNDTFNPKSSVYKESLGIIGSIPGTWLIITLLVLLIYLLTRCCDKKPRNQKSIKCLKITLMVLCVLCCGAIGVGLFGNDDLHNAMLQAIQNGKQISALVNTVKNQTAAIEEALGTRARAPLARLGDVLDSPVANQTALGTLIRALTALRYNASAAVTAADNLRRPLLSLDLDPLLKKVWMYEMGRWAGGMAMWCACGAVCVALLAAAARRSRRALVLLAGAALAALAACWLAAAALLAASVAGGDACMDPAAVGADLAPAPIPKDVVYYYLSCKVSKENMFTAELRNAQRAVVAVRNALAVMSRGAPIYFTDPGLQPALGALGVGTGEAERALVALSTALECRTARSYFVSFSKALCDAGMQAMALQLLASVLAGLLFSIIVLITSHAWIYLSNKRSGTGEERAPFLAGNGAASACPGMGGGVAVHQARTLPRPVPCPNGKPPSYSAAVQLMDMAERERPRSRMSGSATLGRGAGGAHAGAGAGTAGGRLTSGSHTLGRAPHAAGKYATLNKQCKTLESNDFY